MGFQANGIEVEVVQGDITDQSDMDAIVNAANAELRMGGGVAGAIHRAAGSELDEETRPLAPINTGEAVMTSAPNLPNRYIIHCLGPVHGVDDPASTLLASCYQRALELAEDAGLESVAFPAISTGAFGFPMEQAAEVASRTILARSGSLQSVRRLRWVLFSEEDRILHEEVFESVLNA
ncbi:MULTISPECIES: macro domain-containing protein [Gammaproteobacteria]|uniref:RNase III inhibitor n=1 Tax=Vreelandella halophila TaxID=86177 RepID=A0A9X5B4Y2_9GAMM|nr:MULTISPECIES: macro domain-containing protein [Gammaproteobacteria]KAA8982985.1 macro domain-containing protein [Halospina sp. K52047b]MYL25843.1 RNase III inhibitor [Halomonas utahensis]MYL73595.1 RNase III inhibitor [Halomonas sp. 22501_18_FS]